MKTKHLKLNSKQGRKRLKRLVGIIFITVFLTVAFGLLLQHTKAEVERVNIEEDGVPLEPRTNMVENRAVSPQFKALTAREMKEAYGMSWEQYIDMMQINPEEKAWLVKVGKCETGFRENAVGYSSIKGGLDGYHDSPPLGMYQILPETWNRFQCKGNIMNGYDNIDCALKGYRMGRGYEWACA